MGAGHLVVSPTSITKSQELGTTTTASVSFKNDGTAPAHVKLSERTGSFQILSLVGARRINIHLEEEDAASPEFLGDHEHGDVPGVDAGAPHDPSWSQIANYPSAVMDNSADFLTERSTRSAASTAASRRSTRAMSTTRTTTPGRRSPTWRTRARSRV